MKKTKIKNITRRKKYENNQVDDIVKIEHICNKIKIKKKILKLIRSSFSYS